MFWKETLTGIELMETVRCVQTAALDEHCFNDVCLACSAHFLPGRDKSLAAYRHLLVFLQQSMVRKIR